MGRQLRQSLRESDYAPQNFPRIRLVKPSTGPRASTRESASLESQHGAPRSRERRAFNSAPVNSQPPGTAVVRFSPVCIHCYPNHARDYIDKCSGTSLNTWLRAREAAQALSPCRNPPQFLQSVALDVSAIITNVIAAMLFKVLNACARARARLPTKRGRLNGGNNARNWSRQWLPAGFAPPSVPS